jgi:hypothetical protein
MGSVWSGTVGAEDTCLHCGPSLGGKQLIDIHTLVHDAWVESQDAIIRPCSGSRVPSLQDPTVVFEQCTGRCSRQDSNLRLCPAPLGRY